MGEDGTLKGPMSCSQGHLLGLHSGIACLRDNIVHRNLSVTNAMKLLNSTDK